MLNNTCWKIKSEKKSSSITYNIQLSGIDRKQVKTFLEIMSGWEKYADGHTAKGLAILIFRRNFDSNYDWVKWSRSFPYDLFEEKDSGKLERIKRYKSSKKVKHPPPKKSEGRVCSSCNGVGHNKRTCPDRLVR